jgi:hypothetical protein
MTDAATLAHRSLDRRRQLRRLLFPASLLLTDAATGAYGVAVLVAVVAFGQKASQLLLLIAAGAVVMSLVAIFAVWQLSELRGRRFAVLTALAWTVGWAAMTTSSVPIQGPVAFYMLMVALHVYVAQQLWFARAAVEPLAP